MSSGLFGAVDHVSSIDFPYRFPFTTPEGRAGRVYGISALALLNQSFLLALCDRSRILSARVRFDVRNLLLEEVAWQDWWQISTEDGGPLDVEGLAVLPDGRVLVSTEPGPVWALPDLDAWPAGSAGLRARPLQRLPPAIGAGVARNWGLEALTVGWLTRQGTHGSRVVTVLEGYLAQDASTVRRAFEMDASTGAITAQRAVRVEGGEPWRLLTELAAVEVAGLGGGGLFLALERAFSDAAGDEIRLWLLNTTGSADVDGCVSIAADENRAVALPPGTTQCNINSADAVQKESVISRWAPDRPLGGVTVDNYEGMTLVTPAALGRRSNEALGGQVVLLVNDNNDNPQQIGTQFVLMRLPYAPVSEPEPPEPALLPHPPAYDYALVLLVALLALPCAAVAGGLWKLYGRRVRRRFNRFEDEPGIRGAEPREPAGAASPGDIEVTVVGRVMKETETSEP